ncbi:Ca(2+)-dependent cysteine protease [Entomortierella chlamydospora]|nr:Ca(2+)-dependent cysteine protease [Entomortierella chlamydospora]
MSFSSSSLAISNDDIDPAILADVTRVVQELMRMQQLELEQQQQQQQEDKYNHNINRNDDAMDDSSSISHEFHCPDSLDHADKMEVDVSLPIHEDKEVRESQTKDQSSLLSSSSSSSFSSSSIISPSSQSSRDSPASSIAPQSSLLVPPSSKTSSALSINTKSGSDQVLIDPLPGQKTPTRATSSATGPTNGPDEETHKYYEHDSTNKNAKGANTTIRVSGLSETAIIPRSITPTPSRPRRKKALLIGINYFGDPNQLLGCINDTRDVFGFLNGYFGFRYQDTIMLTDDQVYEDKRPTGANIRYWMKWLVKDAEPQDSLFFHYAVGDESDGYDEIIYPCDYLRSGIISDDEMYDLMVKELPEGVQLTALVDACHSGTMLDLPYVYNGNHVTALEKVTRKKVGAMAAMSAENDTVFESTGSNNGVQTMTTTTTTTTTTITTRNADGTDFIVKQVTNGTAMTTDGNLAPPGGLPPINPKEGGSPLLCGKTHSKRSISSTEDGVDDNSDIDALNDDMIPTLTISDSKDSQPYSSFSLSVEPASDNSDSECLKPSAKKRSRSTNNNAAVNQVDVYMEEEVSVMSDNRGIECSPAPIEIMEVVEANPNEEKQIVGTQSTETQDAGEQSEEDEEGMHEARRMAMFRKTKGNVVMFSGCRDDQASADIRASAKDAAIISNHHKSLNGGTASWSPPSMENDGSNPLGYSLPQPYSTPLARGAVSYAWIQCLSQKTNQTYEELLISMRHFMKQRDLEQIPQLGSGMPMDMRTENSRQQSSFFWHYLTVWSSVDTENEIGPRITSDATAPEDREEKALFHHHYRHDIIKQQQDDKKERPPLAQQLEKQRLKKQRKLENAERARKKEQKRFRQAAKLLRIQQLDMEPFLALISTNNARLTVLNSKEFARFCHVKEAEEEEEEEDSSSFLVEWITGP